MPDTFLSLNKLFSGDDLHLIAGPCSAETEEQVLITARQLCRNPAVKLFRAGIWKPRTRPNSFEGVGSEALNWLIKAKTETGLPFITEAANPGHVEECLKAGADAIWIGARTTANPFMVQEIADSLRGVPISVVVKNPINPDLQLWIGAAERLLRAGIPEVALMHRGFSVYGKHAYRNPPQWEIPIEMMRIHPELMMLCDPSHISGRRDGIFAVAQQALDLRMKGLMIETHPDPDNARSDAAQQITPAVLSEIGNKLVLRKDRFANAISESMLESFRQKIDEIDDELIGLLFRRKQVVSDIAHMKAGEGVRSFQPERYNEIVDKAQKEADRLGMDPDFLVRLLRMIHEESLAFQNEILNTASEGLSIS